MSVARPIVPNSIEQATAPHAAWLAFPFAFVLLYNPTIVVIESSLVRALVLYGLVAGAIGAAWLVWPRRFVELTLFLVGSFAVAFGIVQMIAMSGGGDTTSIAFMFASLTGFIPAAYVLARACSGEGGHVATLLRVIAWAGAFQAVCIVLDWISPTVHALFASIVVQPDLSTSLLRASGLSSSAGDGLAFCQAIATMAAAHLALVATERATRLRWTLVTALCLASIMLAGRTGFAMFAVFVIVVGTSWSRALRVGRMLTAIAAFGLAGALVLYYVLPYELVGRLVDRLLPYAFEFIYNYLGGEGLRTASTDDLRTMLFLPHDGSTLLFGDGYWKDPIDARANYMGTDIGYVRTIYYVGVIGSVLVYTWYAFLWREIRTKALDLDLRRFVDAFFVVMFLAHVKFPFLFLGTGLSFMFALYFALHLEEERCASAA